MDPEVRLLLSDIVWWLRGYIAGSKDQMLYCPFDKDHLDALEEVIKKLRREEDIRYGRSIEEAKDPD